MEQTNPNTILTTNSGSSSLKLAVYGIAREETLILGIEVDRIGEANGRLTAVDGRGEAQLDLKKCFPNQEDALEAGLQFLDNRGLSKQIHAISHRVVHGGNRYEEPQLITPQLVSKLRELISIDPDHLPQTIRDIEVLSQRYPGVPQVACFDTAFHRTMPRVAQLCPLPTRYFDNGVLRYGFHGISYEYILSELRVLDGALAGGRIVIAHLGNGSSMAAIKDGRSLDTTMGFTPTSGLLMGTRSVDIDPGVLVHLLLNGNMRAEEIGALLNKRAGLLGVSETSANMQELLAEEEVNPKAAEAIALFCYRAKKYLAAYIAVLGGLDVVVFTTGIGEHAPTIRERICSGLEMFGIRIDSQRNRRNAPVISSDCSRVKVRVMKTNENAMLARHAAEVLKGTSTRC
jgi:acetate kinase